MAVIQGQFYSKHLSKIVSFSAIMPVDVPSIPGQDEPVNQKPMRTLYLLHGYSGNHTDWLHGTRIEALALKHHIAVIMPSGDNSFYLDHMDTGSHYGQFIGEELPEMMGRLLQLDNAKTYIAGLSMGGFGAIQNGLRYFERFDGIMALSSALIVDQIADIEPGFTDAIATYGYYRSVFGDLKQLRKSDKDPKGQVINLLEKNKKLPRIYIACGTDDFLIEHNRDFHEFLKDKGIAHDYVEGPGVHDWVFWDTYIEKALNWMNQDQ